MRREILEIEFQIFQMFQSTILISDAFGVDIIQEIPKSRSLIKKSTLHFEA